MILSLIYSRDVFHGVYRPLSKSDLPGAELAAPLTGALGASSSESLMTSSSQSLNASLGALRDQTEIIADN
jgi:hypothetical protein